MSSGVVAGLSSIHARDGVNIDRRQATAFVWRMLVAHVDTTLWCVPHGGALKCIYEYIVSRLICNISARTKRLDAAFVRCQRKKYSVFVWPHKWTVTRDA